jgi:hypothetical protein
VGRWTQSHWPSTVNWYHWDKYRFSKGTIELIECDPVSPLTEKQQAHINLAVWRCHLYLNKNKTEGTKRKKNGASLLFCPILQSSLHKISSFSYPFLFLCVVMSCKVSESSRREQDRRQLQLTVRAACSYTWMHPNSQYSLSTWTLISASCQNEALHIASSPSLHLECTYFSLSTGLQTPLHFQSNDATQTLPACAFHLQSEGPFQRANTG